MHVTLMIGNGFDLGVGLPTKYTDFLNSYLRAPCSNPDVAASKKRIGQEMNDGINTWADMEMALGRFAVGCTEASFAVLLDDLKQSLSWYFRNIQTMIRTNAANNQIHDCFQRLLGSPYDRLPDEDRGPVENAWRERFEQVGSIDYHFLSFNYSNVFDTCLDVFRTFRQTPMPGDPPLPRNCRFHDLVHVHGIAERGVVLGVDNPGQIHNDFSQRRNIQSRFIKAAEARALRERWTEKGQSAISRSRFIVIYGMSLGESDERWWLLLGKWLAWDSRRHLIVFYTNPDMNCICPHNFDEAQYIVCTAFARNVGRVRFAEIRNRIHVVFNNAPFTFTLANIPPGRYAPPARYRRR